MSGPLEAYEASGGSPPLPPYLTAPQVASLLQVSPKTVYRWADTEPTLPVLRVGGTVRFPRERLFRWLQNREQGWRRGQSGATAAARGADAA